MHSNLAVDRKKVEADDNHRPRKRHSPPGSCNSLYLSPYGVILCSLLAVVESQRGSRIEEFLPLAPASTDSSGNCETSAPAHHWPLMSRHLPRRRPMPTPPPSTALPDSHATGVTGPSVQYHWSACQGASPLGSSSFAPVAALVLQPGWMISSPLPKGSHVRSQCLGIQSFSKQRLFLQPSYYSQGFLLPNLDLAGKHATPYLDLYE